MLPQGGAVPFIIIGNDLPGILWLAARSRITLFKFGSL